MFFLNKNYLQYVNSRLLCFVQIQDVCCLTLTRTPPASSVVGVITVGFLPWCVGKHEV